MSDKREELQVFIKLNGEYRNITSLTYNISIKFSIFELSSRLNFIYRDIYDFDITPGDTLMCEITDLNTNSKTKLYYSVFGIRFFKGESADTEKMEFIVDALDVHSFGFYQSSDSMFLNGDVSTMIETYMKHIFSQNNLTEYPINFDTDSSNITMDEFLSLTRHVIKEIQDLLSYGKSLIAYRSIKTINIKNFKTFIKTKQSQPPVLIISEKEKNQNQNFTYSFQYNYDYYQSLNNGLYGYYVHTWDKTQNKMKKFYGDVEISEGSNSPVVSPTVKYWFSPNFIFNFGYTMKFNQLKLYDIGDIFKYNALNLTSKYNGNYMIIDVDILKNEKGLVSYNYILLKI